MRARRRNNDDDPAQRLRHLEQQLEILRAATLALDHVHEVVDIVASRQEREDAAHALARRFEVSSTAATAMLDLQLHRLGQRERSRLQSNLNVLETKRHELLALLQQ